MSNMKKLSIFLTVALTICFVYIFTKTTGSSKIKTIKLFLSGKSNNIQNGSVTVALSCTKLRVSTSFRIINLQTGFSILKIVAYLPGDMISDSIANSGSWEPQILNELKSYLEANVQYDFIDIGCNIGVYTLFAASMNRSVLSVDANVANVVMLKKSLRLNNLTKKVTVLCTALSSKYQSMQIKAKSDNIGGHGVENIVQNRSDKYYQVSSILMDDLLRYFTFRKAIMKIDIEGSEVLALRNGTKFFDQIKIPLILFEWGSYLKKPQEANEVINFMTHRRYQPYATILSKIKLEKEKFKTWPWDIVWRKE